MGVRNLIILTIAQMVSLSGTALLVLIGGLIGATLAPSHALATLPISLMVIGLAASTVPAALFMQRFGRRRGFAVAAAVAGLAIAGAALAVAARDFWLFCAATFVVGGQGAFAQQYRFAAAESVPQSHAGRAVSFVLVGGIAAGWLGPELAVRGKDWLKTPHTGTLILQAVLFGLMALLLLALRDTAPAARADAGTARPLREIVAAPPFVLAATAAATAYAVMSFIMTAAPLELHEVRRFDFADTAWVIKSHVIAMFLPSLVTGLIIEWLGVLVVILAGTTCLAACAVLALVSQHLVHYWAALVLLGVGWNFQFVGATVLLARATRPADRYKVQAANDFLVFGAQALAALTAGGVLFSAGWRTLNLLALAPLALTAAGALALRRAALAPAR